VITTSYPSHADDPSGHFVRAEAHALARAGWRVTVLAPAVGGARARPAAARGAIDLRWLPAGDAFGPPGALARLSRRPWRAFGAERFVRAARRELRTLGDATRVVAHFIVPSAFPIAAFTGAPPVEVVVHGSDLALLEVLPGFVRRRIAERLEGASFRCVSEDLRARLGRALRAEFAERARVAPSPIELDRAPTRSIARRELGVQPEERLLVVVGRLLPFKGGESALRAARLVPRARVVVVGEGPERARLERSYPEAVFTGAVPRSRAVAWIAAADVLLSASEREGAPTVVREARALGTRVVALPAGDLASWARSDPGLTVVGEVG
jgi:glycosyltransferase involved in cell wall biosynthesis